MWWEGFTKQVCFRLTVGSIQTKVRVYQALVLSILLYASETWTSLASDMKAIESFHMKCLRRILGIRWHDFVRNSDVSLRTGLAPVSDWITRGRNAIFGHVARLPYNIPAHQAMLRQVELSVGRPPDPTWKRPPGRPRTKWTDQLRRDNDNVPIATLWRQAIGRGHSRATLWSVPTTPPTTTTDRLCLVSSESPSYTFRALVCSISRTMEKETGTNS